MLIYVLKVNRHFSILLTWCAADISAGSNAENAAAAAAAAAALDEKCECDIVDCVTLPLRNDGKLTYGATRHGSNGVDIGGLWLDNSIPGVIVCVKKKER